MRPFLRGGALCLPFVIAIIAACSDDPAETGSSFDLALTIVGEGAVTSDPAGIDCVGPKDCGTKTYAANASVKLVPAAAAGFALSKIDIGGTPSTDGIVTGAAGATAKVTVTFVPSGAGAGGDAGGGNDDAGTAADAGDGGVPDGTACTTPDGCGTSSVCCRRSPPATDRIVPAATTSCESPTACKKANDAYPAGAILCSAAGDPRCGTGYGCEIEGTGPGTCVAQL